MSSLDAVVQELGWSASRSRAPRFLLHASIGALGWAAAVLLVERAVPLEVAPRVAALGIPLAVVAVLAGWFLTRPRPSELTRLADLRLDLKERLSTAWERRGEDGPMDAALRQDALDHVVRVRLAAAFPVRLHRGEAALVVVVAIGCLGLAFFPNPMNQVLAQRQADRVSQSRAASAISDAQKKIASSTSPAAVDPKLEKILQDAQAKIGQAVSPLQALQAITPAEQQLQQLSDPQTPARTSSAQNLANSLSTTNAGRIAGQAILSSPSTGAQALRDLATQLQGLSQKDLNDLAKALADAAQHARDPQTAVSLQRASDSLRSGDIASAGSALIDVAGQLDSLQQQQNNDQAVAAAINGLESARQQLAAQADRDAGQSTQANASASASPGASTVGSGSGNGNGNGNANGNGSGNGSGSANGVGNSNGTGGSGGTGTSGSGSGSGAAAHSTERLYVPGQPVPGQSSNDPTPLGPGQDVPLTPYAQVIRAYEQAALDATNQSLIPGSEADLIRQYFSQLGEPQAGP